MSRDEGIFIMGCGRSGTTLLREMMNAHTRMAISHESRFPSFMVRNRKRYERDRFRLDRFLDDLFTLPVDRSRFFALGLEPAQVGRELAARAPADLGQALEEVFRLYARARGKERWGDKTPGLLAYAEELAEVLPSAKFVHIVRDGRDVAAAYRDAPFGASRLSHAALHWQRQVSFAQRLRAGLSADRYFGVWYEDLIEEPKRVLEAVCEFCGVAFEPGMLDHRSVDDDASYAGQSHHASVRGPLDPNLRDWRRDLSSAEVAGIERLIGPSLAACGYEVGVHDGLNGSWVDRCSGLLARRQERVRTSFGSVRRWVGDRAAPSSMYGPLKKALVIGRS